MPEPPLTAQITLLYFAKEETKTLPQDVKLSIQFWTPMRLSCSAPGNATTYYLIKKLSMESCGIFKKNMKANHREENHVISGTENMLMEKLT
jgi:hypothetical protein